MCTLNLSINIFSVRSNYHSLLSAPQEQSAVTVYAAQISGMVKPLVKLLGDG